MQNRDKKYTIFEYDEIKSISNKVKHGLDFSKAKQLWDDPELIELKSPESSEPRFLNIGLIAKKHWTAIITYRENNVRIISVRRSRNEEIHEYQSKRT